MIPGLDLLGIGSNSFPIGQAVAALQDSPVPLGIGAFDGGWPHAFGDPRAHLSQLIATGKVPLVRVHVWWDKTHSTNPHAICPMDVLSHACAKWQQFAQNHPQTRVYLSHSCEYSEKSVVEVQKRISCVKTLASLCIPVSTPLSTAPAIAGTIFEQHGSKAHAGQGGAASMDGQCVSDIDSEGWFSRNAGAVYAFAWDLRCNGSHSGDNPDPNQRAYWPDKKYLDSLIRYCQPRGPVPVPNFPFAAQLTPFDGVNLWKAQSEDTATKGGKPNPWAYRPAFICTEHGPDAEVIDINGNLIAKMQYSEPFLAPANKPLLHRYLYRSTGLYAVEMARIAKANTGSEFGAVRVNNKYFGLGNLAFRNGSFL